MQHYFEKLHMTMSTCKYSDTWKKCHFVLLPSYYHDQCTVSIPNNRQDNQKYTDTHDSPETLILLSNAFSTEFAQENKGEDVVSFNLPNLTLQNTYVV